MRRSYYGFLILTCVAAAIGLSCSENRGFQPEPPHYGITPDSVDVEVSSAQEFLATFESQPLEIAWYVDGILGGSPRSGMITQEGLFIAPHEPPEAGYATITAEAALDGVESESAKAYIRSGEGIDYIRMDPDSAVLAPGDSVQLSAIAHGCDLSDPLWLIETISGDAADIGTIRPNGIYVAPEVFSTPFTLMVTVASLECADKVGIGRISVEAPMPFIVRFEDFTDSLGTLIDRTVTCSGGHAVTGFQNGDWIDVPYQVPASGSYTAEIHYAAGVGDTLTVIVQEKVCAGSAAAPGVTFRLDHGNGLG